MPEFDVRRRLKAARALAGLSVKELAERLDPKDNLGERTLRKLESGESVVRPIHLREIARVLGLPYAFFTEDFAVMDPTTRTNGRHNDERPSPHKARTGV